MTYLRLCTLLVLLALVTEAFAFDPAPVDTLVGDAIGRRLIAGGVVLIGSRDRILFQRAYGRLSPLADAAPVSLDTVFDLASLTKVVATAPSVLKLAQEGRLSLLDPLVKWFPEFAGKGKDRLLVYHLLTHTSGLDDAAVSGPDPIAGLVQAAADRPLHGEIGSRFRYADLNFILLAELVRRATGAPLDLYAQASFYRPLAMNTTTFHPDSSRCAATLSDDLILTGAVQDRLCRVLGGVAGHAGLFSTAADLARFSRMMLAGGSLEGRRVLAERTVAQMTAPYYSRGGEVVRGLGWDIASPFSAPKGRGFSALSFGHTGYAGSSLWIDPDSELFVILLTVRLDYQHVKDFNRFRSDLSTLAAALFAPPAELREMARFHDE